MLGDGNGGFSAGVFFPVGVGPVFVVAGSFDGDGNADLAVANSGLNQSDGTLGPGSVTILHGNGVCGFSPGGPFAAGPGVSSLAVGDFDGDGKLDLVVAKRRQQQYNGLAGQPRSAADNHVCAPERQEPGRGAVRYQRDRQFGIGAALMFASKPDLASDESRVSRLRSWCA
ncbi:MAG TPA: VCBS repeat-containing protein [Bryobacteraceae bacterium]|nr:VCBS repeat-containing protein [Bryobacteraceae bacterium]